MQLPSTHITKEEDRSPTDAELMRLLDHCLQLKYRVGILCLASSGLRINTFLSLRWGDVDLETYPDVAYAMVKRVPGRKFGSRGRRSSTPRNLFVTWFSTEARDSLLEYRRYREAQGEAIIDESPLINSDLNPEQAISYSAFHDRWQAILERAGLTEKKGRFYVLHINTLRKRFHSNCVGVDRSYWKMLMGHKGGYLDESYFRADQDCQVEQYRKVLAFMNVYKSGADVKQLQTKINELKANVSEADEVRAEVALIKKILRE